MLPILILILSLILGLGLSGGSSPLRADTSPSGSPAVSASASTASPSPSAGQSTVSGVLAEIRTRYGVTIADGVEALYSSQDQDTGQITPNLVPDLAEARVIEAAIARLPSPGYFAPIFILAPNTAPGAIMGGEYLGYGWPCFLHPRAYPGGFVYDRLLAPPAAELLLPAVSLDTPLPVKSRKTSLLPLLEEIGLKSSGVVPNLTEMVPWTTEGERLTQTVVHEFAHAIADAVSLANSPTVREYWDRQSFVMYDHNTWDISNPLYVSFAALTGWRLVSVHDYVAQYDPAEAAAERASDPVQSQERLWERDPAVWGDLAHRRNRLTIYASYGPIQESFAEFYMAAVLYPNLLTAQERTYFARLNAGLAADPTGFVAALVADPMRLLAAPITAPPARYPPPGEDARKQAARIRLADLR
jgi:hypothetical protein